MCAPNGPYEGCKRDFALVQEFARARSFFELMRNFERRPAGVLYRHVKLVERNHRREERHRRSPGVPFLKESLFRPVLSRSLCDPAALCLLSSERSGGNRCKTFIASRDPSPASLRSDAAIDSPITSQTNFAYRPGKQLCSILSASFMELMSFPEALRLTRTGNRNRMRSFCAEHLRSKLAASASWPENQRKIGPSAVHAQYSYVDWCCFPPHHIRGAIKCECGDRRVRW